MKVGMIDCDAKNSKHIFPNLPLMKISAWHKSKGDSVEWYDPFKALSEGEYDKVKDVHFAWDRYEDKDIILPKLKAFKDISQWDRRKIIVYTLVGDRERRVTETDLERIYTLRELGAYPYVMIYDKQSLPKGHELKLLQRWVNNRFIWEAVNTFDEYLKG